MKQLTLTNAWPIRVKIMELVKTRKEASSANVLKDGKESCALVNINASIYLLRLIIGVAGGERVEHHPSLPIALLSC